MARIKIKNLPKEMKVSEEEMRKAMGGGIGYTPQVVIVTPMPNVSFSGSSSGSSKVNINDALPPSGSSFGSSAGDEAGVGRGTVSSGRGGGSSANPKINP